MTESEWMMSEDPARMLAIRRTSCCGCLWFDNGDGTVSLGNGQRACGQCDNGPISPEPVFSHRKLRLWASAACREAFRLTGGPTPASVQLCDLSDMYADELIPYSELEAFKPSHPDCSWPLRYKENIHTTILNTINAKTFLPGQANLVRCVCGNPFRRVRLCGQMWGDQANGPCWKCDRIRTPIVLAIAQAIYVERTFDELPLVADALLDAGCDNEDILRHLRGEEPVLKLIGGPSGQVVRNPMYRLVGWRPLQGPHVRGCWALDLILSKE